MILNPWKDTAQASAGCGARWGRSVRLLEHDSTPLVGSGMQRNREQ